MMYALSLALCFVAAVAAITFASWIFGERIKQRHRREAGPRAQNIMFDREDDNHLGLGGRQ